MACRLTKVSGHALLVLSRFPPSYIALMAAKYATGSEDWEVPLEASPTSSPTAAKSPRIHPQGLSEAERWERYRARKEAKQQRKPRMTADRILNNARLQLSEWRRSGSKGGVPQRASGGRSTRFAEVPLWSPTTFLDASRGAQKVDTLWPLTLSQEERQPARRSWTEESCEGSTRSPTMD